jgi:hypothetical protein
MSMLYSRKHTIQSVCGSNGLDDGWPQLAVAGKTMSSGKIGRGSAPPSLRLPSRGPCAFPQNCSRKHPHTRQGICVANARVQVSLLETRFIDERDRASCRRGKTSVQDIGRSGEARLSELRARCGQLNEIVAEQNRLRSLDDAQLGRAHSQQNQPKRWVRARVTRGSRRFRSRDEAIDASYRSSADSPRAALNTDSLGASVTRFSTWCDMAFHADHCDGQASPDHRRDEQLDEHSDRLCRSACQGRSGT